MTQGHQKEAADQFKIVVKLLPNDRLSAQLLQSLEPANSAPSGSGEPIAKSDDSAPPRADPDLEGKLPGVWTAAPDKETSISLSIMNDGGFTWKVARQGRSHQLRGQTSHAGGVLTLVQAEGPPMVGRLIWRDKDDFVFQALGGGPSDPGLSFQRSSSN